MSLSDGSSIIIPTFNEEKTIKKLIADIQNTLADLNTDHEIIIVDDGSTDNTFSIANDIPGIKVIKHPYNKGNGAAVKTGIFNATRERIIIIDADGQHDPNYIVEMLNLLDQYDLVVGSRESFGIGRRGFGNHLVSKLAGYLSGIPIPDLTSGYRAFKKEKMLEFIHLLPNGFSLPSTSTLAFATSGYNIKFIPISVRVRRAGESSINVLRDGIKFLVLIVRMISLFKPLKVFVPTSLFFIFMSFIWAVRTMLYSYKVSSTLQLSPTVTMLFLMGILIFLFGLLADQMAETRLSIGKINKILMKNNNKHED